MTADEQRAAVLAGTLWAAICLGQAAARQYFPAVFSPDWLAGLALPSAGALPLGQPAAMPGGGQGGFERHADAAALRAAYRYRPRTRIYEDIGWAQQHTWAALASRHLTGLAGGPRVTVTVYESASGDQALGTHRDTWLGVIVQVSGVKDWQLGEGLLNATGPPATTVTMAAGDVLLVPKSLPHLVSTPVDPGRSVHLVFAFNRELPDVNLEFE